MGIMESINNVFGGEKKPSAVEQEIEAKEKLLKGLRVSLAEVIKNKDATQRATIEGNIKVLEKHINDLESGKDIPWYNQERR